MQFTNFALAANQKLLLAGLQRKDAAFLSAIITGVGMGYLVSILKHKISGRDLPDHNQLMVEAVDRSGILSLPMLAINRLPAEARQAMGLEVSRYERGRGVAAFLGPSLSTVDKMWKATDDTVGAIANKTTGGKRGSEFDRSALRNIMGLMPWQNWYGMKQVMDEAEKNLSKKFNLKGKKKKRRN